VFEAHLPARPKPRSPLSDRSMRRRRACRIGSVRSHRHGERRRAYRDSSAQQPLEGAAEQQERGCSWMLEAAWDRAMRRLGRWCPPPNDYSSRFAFVIGKKSRDEQPISEAKLVDLKEIARSTCAE